MKITAPALLICLLGLASAQDPVEVRIPGRLGLPLVTAERTWVRTYAGTLYAFDSKTGRKLWRLETSAPLYNRPALEEGVLYVGGQDGFMRALDAETGEERWSFECGRVDWGMRDRFIDGEVTLVEDMVLFSSEDWNVYALDEETGEEFWRCKLGEEPQAFQLPVVDGVAYIGAWDGYLYAIDIGLGEIKWRSQTDNDHVGQTLRKARGELYWKSDNPDGETLPNQSPSVTVVPIVVDDSVYFTDWAGSLMAVDRETRKQRWRYKADTPDLRHVGSRFTFVHAPDVLYFGTQEDGHLYAIDRKTGEEQWRLEIGGTFYGPFRNIEASLLVLEERSGGHGLRLKAIDLTSRKVAWERGDVAGFPCILEGVVYVPNTSGTLLGIDAGSGRGVWRLGSR